MIHQCVAYTLLEEDGTLEICQLAQCDAIEEQQCSYPLFVGMQLARSEHVGVHIPLCSFAKVLVFLKDLSIEVTDICELLVGGVLVAIHFVLDFAGRR
jgi:hypothetical protein